MTVIRFVHQTMSPRLRGFPTKTKNLILIGSVLLNLYLLLPQYDIPPSHPRIVYRDRQNITHKTSPVRKHHKTHNQHKVVHKKKLLSVHDTNTIYCQAKSTWADKAIQHPTTTNMVDWSFKTRRKCALFKILDSPTERQQIVLHCETNNSHMFTTVQKQSDKITSINFGDQCLIDVIDSCCYDKNTKVPNVAHFIWFGDSGKELGYFQYLTFMSLLRFMKPCLILIHGPSVPYGKYWDSFISQTPNVIHVQRARPNGVYGHPLAFKEHASDLMRIEALQKYGGVYVDFDEVILRSLDPLRKYQYTQGHELGHTLGSQLVLAMKNATFLTHWHLSYRDNYKKNWAYNALWVPWIIASRHPGLIHVEGYNFTRPSWKDVKLIYNKNYDWSTNYGMHLYIRWYNRTINTDIIRTLNTTIGSVSRHILFGNKELCIK